MAIIRTYSLDIDTKKYINRVNSYRKLNGIAPLLPPDIVDIDNFVVGLKDLNLWTNTLCFLTRENQNIGTGTFFLPIGGSSVNNTGYIYTVAGPNSSSWTNFGIKQNVSTSGGGQLIGLGCNIKNINATNQYTLFGCLNVNNGGFYGLGVNQILGTFSNSRRSRLIQSSNYDITTTESINESQFFLNFAYLSKNLVTVKNNSFNGTSATGNYNLPNINLLTFGSNFIFFLNYGFLVTQAMFGVVYNVNIANSIGNQFYNLYKETTGKGLPSL